MGWQRVAGWEECRAQGWGQLHLLSHSVLMPVQCFSFNGHNKGEIVKWPEAKQVCESQGAVLATIASPLEQGRSLLHHPPEFYLPGVVLSISPVTCSFHHIHAAQHLL